jgi:hypothetical protein
VAEHDVEVIDPESLEAHVHALDDPTRREIERV